MDMMILPEMARAGKRVFRVPCIYGAESYFGNERHDGIRFSAGQNDLDFATQPQYNKTDGDKAKGTTHDDDRRAEANPRQPIVVGGRKETPAVNRTLEQVAAFAKGNGGASETARTLASLDKPRFQALLSFAAKLEGTWIDSLSKVADIQHIIGVK